MYLILRGIVAYIAPIMSFTADEIYEAMPGAKAKSVHVTDFPRTTRSPENASWDARVQAARGSDEGARARARRESRSASRSRPTSCSTPTRSCRRRRSVEDLHRLARRRASRVGSGGRDVVEIEGLGKSESA
jgi:isoleucyl-tRNA synthetase